MLGTTAGQGKRRLDSGRPIQAILMTVNLAVKVLKSWEHSGDISWNQQQLYIPTTEVFRKVPFLIQIDFLISHIYQDFKAKIKCLRLNVSSCWTKYTGGTDRSFLNDLLPWSSNLSADCQKLGKERVNMTGASLSLTYKFAPVLYRYRLSIIYSNCKLKYENFILTYTKSWHKASLLDSCNLFCSNWILEKSTYLVL